MEKFHQQALQNLETAIAELEIEIDCLIQRMEVIIKTIVKCLSEVKEFVLKRGFKNTEEEIRFFKYQKPAIVAKLVYYNTIYKIETKKPTEAKAIKKYLKVELKKLKRFFNNNLDFYKYYHTTDFGGCFITCKGK